MRTSQMRAVLSTQVTIRRPSGLNAALCSESALCTKSMRPLKQAISDPVRASQIRAVSSQAAVTIRRPSGLNAAA